MNVEARYLRASRGAHRAWIRTQPQYVIPGLLDGLDEQEVKRAASIPAAASCSSSPPLPLADTAASPGAGSRQHQGDGRMSPEDSRGRRQRGA